MGTSLPGVYAFVRTSIPPQTSWTRSAVTAHCPHAGFFRVHPGGSALVARDQARGSISSNSLIAVCVDGSTAIPQSSGRCFCLTTVIKKRKNNNFALRNNVGVLGIEPSLRAPKARVLPVYDTPISLLCYRAQRRFFQGKAATQDLKTSRGKYAII